MEFREDQPFHHAPAPTRARRAVHAAVTTLAAAVVCLPLAVLPSFGHGSESLSAVPAPRVQESVAPSLTYAPPDLPRLETDQGALALAEVNSRAGGTAVGSFVELNFEDTDVLVVAPAKKLPPKAVPAVKKAGQGLLAYPVTGPVTSHFGMRFHPILRYVKLHTGTDFATGCGTPVGASAAGTVTFVGWFGGDGNRIVVDHGMVGGRRLQTTYNHLSAFAVHVGDRVAQGQGIALTGTTGYSTACHLHFEVMVNGVFVDPLPYLSGQASPANFIPASALTTPAPSGSQSPSASPSPSPSASPSDSPTPSPSPTPTASVSPTPTPTSTPSQSATPIPSQPPAPSQSSTPSQTATPTPTATPSQTPTEPAAPTPSPSAEPTPDPTPEPTAEPTPAPTAEPTATESPAPTATPSPTAAVTESSTPVPSASPSKPPKKRQP